MIRNIQITTNNTEKSIQVENKLRLLLDKYNFNIVSEKADLIIAIGGDGSFIRTLRDNNFNSEPLYVGVHSGHLGFLQEVDSEDIELLIESIINKTYKIEELKLAEITVKTPSKNFKYLALNECTVREKNQKVIHLDVFINDKHVESFSGDGMIVSTPIGSTAYNLSAGGSIIYPSMSVLQVTGLCPLNSKAYRSLQNSMIIPEGSSVRLVPEEYYRKNTQISTDGQNNVFDCVSEIEIKISSQAVKALRFEHYDFWTRIKEKFL